MKNQLKRGSPHFTVSLCRARYLIFTYHWIKLKGCLQRRYPALSVLSSKLPVSSLNNSLICMMVSQVAPNQAHWEAIKIQDQVTQQFSLLPAFCATYLPSTWYTLLLFMTVLFTAPYILELSVAANQQNGLKWVRERQHQTSQGLLSPPQSPCSWVSFISSSLLCS